MNDPRIASMSQETFQSTMMITVPTREGFIRGGVIAGILGAMLRFNDMKLTGTVTVKVRFRPDDNPAASKPDLSLDLQAKMLEICRELVKRGDWYDRDAAKTGRWCGHCGKAYFRDDQSGEWKPDHFDECPLKQAQEVIEAVDGSSKQGANHE